MATILYECPPLVYGHATEADFATMTRWLVCDVSLPSDAIHSQRSWVGLDNLVDRIAVCLRHPNVAGETFLVADGRETPTTELLRSRADAMDVSAHLILCPQVC